MIERYNKEELNKLLIEYSKNKSLELRNKIIIMVFPLINHFAYKYAKLNKIKTKELYSYGVEGLIKAIDKFDITLGEFTSYASFKIIREIKNGIAEIKGYSINSYWNLLMATKDIQKENDRFINNDSEYMIELILKLLEENKISKITALNLIKQNYINNPESIDDKNKDYSHLKVIDPVSIIEQKDMVKKILDSLNERERKIIELRYGFKDEICHTLRDMEKMPEINLTREGIRKIENKTLTKIRKEYK